MEEREKNKTIVSIVHCESYDTMKVDTAIEHSLNNIGEIADIIKSGMHVHVKPNMLSAKDPEKAITTHPQILIALIRRIQKLGATVTIGDSPAGINRPIEEYWEKTGMNHVASNTGAKLVSFEKKGVVEKVVNGNSYFIAQVLADADVVINVCKLKTHSLTLFTGAIKNMFGSIPGVKKGEYHKIAPLLADFSRILVDIFEATKPLITIMDAVIGMEGNGPSSGTPRHFGYILASKDAVAIDAVASYTMGYLPDEILTTRIANERGLGEMELDRIEIKGITCEKLAPQSLILPSNRIYQAIPKFLLKLIGRLIWVRPKADETLCKKCGACIRNCPVGAMVSESGVPQIDYDICIKCFCCDEICPHNAIELQTSWLVQKLK